MPIKANSITCFRKASVLTDEWYFFFLTKREKYEVNNYAELCTMSDGTDRS